MVLRTQSGSLTNERSPLTTGVSALTSAKLSCWKYFSRHANAEVEDGKALQNRSHKRIKPLAKDFETEQECHRAWGPKT